MGLDATCSSPSSEAAASRASRARFILAVSYVSAVGEVSSRLNVFLLLLMYHGWSTGAPPGHVPPSRNKG